MKTALAVRKVRVRAPLSTLLCGVPIYITYARRIYAVLKLREENVTGRRAASRMQIEKLLRYY